MAIHSKARINIYVYQGTIGSYTTNDLRYNLTKDRLPSHEDIVIEIGELIRDYLDNGFDGTTFSPVTRWVTIRCEIYDADGQVMDGSPKEYNYLAVDGYGFFEEGINPELNRHVLLSDNIMYVPQGESAQIPVFAESQSYVTYYGASGQNVGNKQIIDNGNTNQKIQYITAPLNATRIVFDGINESRIIEVNYVCENIYNPIQLTFINRYGAHQQIWMFKKNNRSMTITDETFNHNIISVPNKNYSINQGQKQRFNVNSKTRVEVNTGFVSEDFNNTIEQLLLAEKVWMKEGANVIPVIPLDKSMEYKTDINDKVNINYKFKFEHGFDKINLVR